MAHAFSRLSTVAYRPGARDDWRTDPEALARWQEGQTGVPLVDAGMRQLRAEGWMHNSGNWQWVAGTGNDTRPYRKFNPQRQAERYDPDGAYVNRYVSA